MVSPEMDPTICWMFDAEIVLLFHAKTFHKGFQVTVHIGNVRQTATVEAVYGKVSSSTEPYLLNLGFVDCCLSFRLILLMRHCAIGGAEDGGESSGPLQVHQAPRIPEGGS